MNGWSDRGADKAHRERQIDCGQAPETDTEDGQIESGPSPYHCSNMLRESGASGWETDRVLKGSF